jgi:hypothetical protein
MATTAQTWTPASVRRELPEVPVRLGKKILTARVTGRLNPFATVTVYNQTIGKAPAAPLWIDQAFSWHAIANALNTGRPLNFE